MKIANFFPKRGLNFKGYDAVPIKAIYMQNIPDSDHINIFNELMSACREEKIDLYLSQCHDVYCNGYPDGAEADLNIKYGYLLGPRWAQDHKAFIEDNGVRQILWNTSRDSGPNLNQKTFFSDYKITTNWNFPPGGNYFIGKNSKGEKWLLIGKDNCALERKNCVNFDINTIQNLSQIFGIDEKNVMPLSQPNFHLDMAIRPVGYPYVLVNDPKMAINNIEKIEKKFANYKDEIKSIKDNIDYFADKAQYANVDRTIEELKNYGFIPIRIAGSYGNKINFINAIINKKENGELTYITNSSKNSTPFCEELEKIFINDLKSKTSKLGINISKIVTISGGNSEFPDSNLIMYNLADLRGGIHCMTSEIPKFM